MSDTPYPAAHALFEKYPDVQSVSLRLRNGCTYSLERSIDKPTPETHLATPITVTRSAHARYASVHYDGFLKGEPLTDARIAKYQKEGKYEVRLHAAEERKASRRLSSDDILRLLTK